MSIEQATARWYCLNSDGVATLCIDQVDAEKTAEDADIMYPRFAPHVATQLVPLAAAQAPAEVGRDAWLPIETAPKLLTVLLAYRNSHGRVRVVTACYYPALTVEANEEDQATEYDEESDTHFVRGGWYEDNSEAEIHYAIKGDLLGWAPLPANPIATHSAKQGADGKGVR